MEYKTLTCNGGVSAKDFVGFWCKCYEKNALEKYYLNIKEQTLSEIQILELYTWKNGMKLAGFKQKSLNEKIIPKCCIINELKRNFDEEKFNGHFSNISAIWKIFLLHIISPQTYPIFDQHVYRAYYYLTKGILGELPPDDKSKEELYKKEYVPFFKKIAEQADCDYKMIDECLVSFGQFIKSRYARLFQIHNGHEA
jgi:hypothetical protein